MNVEPALRFARERLARPALLAGCAAFLLARCDLAPQPAPRKESYVTVRLNDSLSRYDKVEVQILSGKDTASVIATLWSGRLEQPGAIPSYRLDGSATGDVSIRVRAWDADGRLALDENISKADGRPVVTAVAIPKPSPRLSALALSAGTLAPAFSPGTHAYSASLPYAQGSIRVTAVPEYAAARLYVGSRAAASGQPSEAVALDAGSNRITVTVLAADTSDQYVLDIVRAAPPDTSKPVPGDTAKPVPGDTAKPVPGDTSKPVPGDTAKPVPGDTGHTVPPVTPADTAFPAWAHKGMVNLHLPSAPAGGPSQAFDFPLLLRLTAANFRFSEARDSGQDLRFMTPRGKTLEYSVARWDAAAQQAEVYVRCDTLASSQSSPIFLMYWGNPKAEAASRASAAFSPSLGWTGVWHLEENGNGQSGEYRDAAASHHGTAGGGYPARVQGPVGYAQDFDGRGSQGRIAIPNDYDPGASRFSMTLWIYRDGTNPAYLFIKSQRDLPAQRFELDLGLGNGNVGFGSMGVRTETGFGIRLAEWTHLGIVCDGDSLRFYANGVFKEARPFAYGGETTGNVFAGVRNPSGEYGFTGKLDELWSFEGVRDPWYMRLLYENQRPGSTLAELNRL